MPAYVDLEKCNGCHGSSQPPCVRMCPGDLYAIDPANRKAYLRDPADCWDCYACVKPCPQEAIEVKLPYQMAFHDASLTPHILSPTMIGWTLVDSHGAK